MDISGELSILRFLVLSTWRLLTVRQRRSAFGVGKGTELVRLRSFPNTVLEYIEKVPPTASRNVLLLTGIREFVAHFGKLVKEGVNDFSIRGES
jgi:hypothetical protein